MLELRWSRSLHLRSEAAAATADVVVVAERQSRLVCLDAARGELRWDQPVEDCWGTVTLTGDRCLYLSQVGVLHCFALSTGDPLWSAPDLPLRHHVTVTGDSVHVGGWRGYHPITRLSLTEGRPLPFTAAHQGPFVRPAPIAGNLLLGGPTVQVITPDGTVQAEWPVPVTADFGLPDNGRVPFLIDNRTVLAYTPENGVQTLWQHDRDLRPLPPLLDQETLWLTDETGAAVIDLTTRAVTRRPGRIRAATRLSGHAAFAGWDRSLAIVDRTGQLVAATRTATPIDQLSPGAPGTLHAIGKGHLATYGVSA